jgi:hypothetical protein
MELNGIEYRARFAWLPIKRFSSEFYQNSCYWMRVVIERKCASSWKAFEDDNA